MPVGTVPSARVLQEQVLGLTAQAVGGVPQAGGTLWGTGLALAPLRVTPLALGNTLVALQVEVCVSSPAPLAPMGILAQNTAWQTVVTVARRGIAESTRRALCHTHLAGRQKALCVTGVTLFPPRACACLTAGVALLTFPLTVEEMFVRAGSGVVVHTLSVHVSEVILT